MGVSFVQKIFLWVYAKHIRIRIHIRTCTLVLVDAVHDNNKRGYESLVHLGAHKH